MTSNTPVIQFLESVSDSIFTSLIYLHQSYDKNITKRFLKQIITTQPCDVFWFRTFNPETLLFYQKEAVRIQCDGLKD